jgi:cation:H+ antiporter
MVIALQLLGGLAVLTAGADLLVRGAAKLAAIARISPLVIGLTVVAYGTSTPELTVSAITALEGRTDIALGNVVGSNIFNVLFILGVSALIIPLQVHAQLLRFDVPLMIGASCLTWVLGFDGRIGLIDGAVLFAGIVAYTGWSVYASRRENGTVQQEFASEFGLPERPASGSRARQSLMNLGLVLAGLALLVLGSKWFVDGASEVARLAGLTELVIGLTVVAAGTSLPEVATSVVAAIKGERDIAVGNVIGSNLFNILGVLGVSGLLSVLNGSGGLAVSETALRFDIPVMIAAAVGCLPIFLTGRTISRIEGAILLFYDFVYTAWLIFSAYGHPGLLTLKYAVLVFALPITAIVLLIDLWRHVRGGDSAEASHGEA